MIFVCASIALAIVIGARPSALAQRDRTAIVNLSSDQLAGEQAAAELRKHLEKHPDLAPLRLGALSRSLEEATPLETAQTIALARAQTALARARTELGDFRYSRALSAAREAERQLLRIPPGQVANQLLARVAFVSAQIHLREQNRGLARAAFELALRLDKTIAPPDPGQFDPDVVRAFDDAMAQLSATAVGTLDIQTNFDATRIFVNGVEVGRSPLAITVPSGTFYVWAVSQEHQIASRRVTIGQGDEVSMSIDLVAIPPRAVAVRLRRDFFNISQDAEASEFAELAQSVIQLTGAESTLIVRRNALQILEVSLFRRRSERGTPFRPLRGNSVGLLSLLSSVDEPAPSKLFFPLPPETPLHRRPEVIIGSAGVLTALIVGGFLVATLATDSSPNERTGILVGFF